MITFKPVVYAHQRRKDGTYNIKIKVTFKRKAIHLPTTLFCTPTDLTRSLKLKNGELIAQSNELIDRMRRACADLTLFDLEDRDVNFVVDHIKRSLKSATFKLDFFEWCDKELNRYADGTRDGYITAINAFERFLGKRSIDINDITKSLLTEFMEFVDNEPKMYYNQKLGVCLPSGQRKKNNGQSTRIVIKLQTLFESAKSKYNDEDSGIILIPRSPFSKLDKEFPDSEGQVNLGVELMQRIISAKTESKTIRSALDAFVVSFGLMGANLADMYYAEPISEEWVYNRSKTRNRRKDKAKMIVRLPAELRPYIERLQSGKSQWWLPELHKRSADKNRCTTAINKLLRRWCKDEGIDVDFTFYAARHTWASLARKAGVEKALVDECLAHKGDFDLVDIYAERDWDKINEANQKVLALFKWE